MNVFYSTPFFLKVTYCFLNNFCCNFILHTISEFPTIFSFYLRLNLVLVILFRPLCFLQDRFLYGKFWILESSHTNSQFSDPIITSWSRRIVKWCNRFLRQKLFRDFNILKPTLDFLLCLFYHLVEFRIHQTIICCHTV